MKTLIDINSNELENFSLEESELINKIRDMIARGSKIKVKAGGHSQLYGSPFIESSDGYIHIEKYVTIPILCDNKLIISAGHTLKFARDFLKPHGLRLAGIPEEGSITIGGAVLMGAHDGSEIFKTVAEYVTDMWLIDGNGSIQHITDQNLFINYGTLGVVFRLGINCVPAKNIAWFTTHTININNITIDPSTFCTYFGPYSGFVGQCRIQEVDYPSYYSLNRLLWTLIGWIITRVYLSKILNMILNYFPWIGLPFSELNCLWEPNVIRDKYDYFNHNPEQPVYTLEYSIDQTKLKECHADIMNVIREFSKKGTYVSYRFWSRFLGKSSNPQSLAYGRDSALMELVFTKNQPASADFAKKLSDTFVLYGGKPHLGVTVIDVHATSNYDFTYLKKAMQKYDPKKLLLNDFQLKVFYPE